MEGNLPTFNIEKISHRKFSILISIDYRLRDILDEKISCANDVLCTYRTNNFYNFILCSTSWQDLLVLLMKISSVFVANLRARKISLTFDIYSSQLRRRGESTSNEEFCARKNWRFYNAALTNDTCYKINFFSFNYTLARSFRHFVTSPTNVHVVFPKDRLSFIAFQLFNDYKPECDSRGRNSLDFKWHQTTLLLCSRFLRSR